MQHVEAAEKAARLNNTQQDPDTEHVTLVELKPSALPLPQTVTELVYIHRTLFLRINQKHWQIHTREKI